MQHRRLWLALVLLGSLPMSAAEFAPPAPPADPSALGHQIQRTMTLLATSTPEHRNRVRILFYGQSVTANPWSYALAEDLKQAYPNADLQVENRAIGGYEAPTLIRTADYDLYPFYPDLTIFHVYGGVKTGQQEELIKRLRQRTTSEVILWTSHFRWPRDLARDGDPNGPAVQKVYQADEERAEKMRELAQTYGCELAEVREAFRAYLQQHDLYPKDTLRDSVHPNELGNYLIRSLVRPYLRYDPALPTDAWRDLVTTVPVDDGRVEHLAGGGLKLTFEGNRIDLLAVPGQAAPTGGFQVKVDGRAPSTYPELYYHARPCAAPGVWWPAINQIGFEQPPVPETWTAKITECDPEHNVLKYEVSGSVTGPDGSGDQSQRFVSNSGRVVIEPGMWMVCRALQYKKLELPADYLVTWETKPLFVDPYQAVAAPEAARESPTTLVQGLSNATHTLELTPTAAGPAPVLGFRIYRPPVQ